MAKLVARLKNEPHAQWLSADPADCIKVVFDGPIGVTWKRSGDAAVVKAVKLDSEEAAAPAGFEAGLMLVSVNGCDVRDKKFAEAVALLRESPRPLTLELFCTAYGRRLPTTGELSQAEAAVTRVAEAAENSGRFIVEARDRLPRSRSHDDKDRQLTAEATVPSTDREPREAAMCLTALKRVAACTPGAATAAQVLEAAQDLERAARRGKAKDRQRVEAAYDAAWKELRQEYDAHDTFEQDRYDAIVRSWLGDDY